MDPRSPKSPVLALLVLSFPTALASCGGAQSEGAAAADSSSALMSCPDPIGEIPRESCADIAADFGALQVSGALKSAGASKGAEQRIAAIRAAGDLAEELKNRRVALCEDYNRCKVAPAAHTAEDTRLAGLMKSLIEAWDARKFQNPDDVERFRVHVASLRDKLEGRAPAAPGEAAPPPGLPGAAPVKIPADALARIEGAGLSFGGSGGAVTITATGEGNHDALRSTPDKLPLSGGKRYLVRVEGTYTPSSAPLIAPGDEITVRLKYRAAAAGEIIVALRSLEDPDASDTTTSFRLTAGATGAQQASFTASPAASGFYVGVGVRGGAVDLDEVEVARGATVLAAARAEAQTEPAVKSGCTVAAQKALAGKASFRCEPGEGDRLTLGMPAGHLYLAIRSAAGERALLRTLSLAGGRSLDAALNEDAQLFVGLAGPGTATVQGVSVQTLGK